MSVFKFDVDLNNKGIQTKIENLITDEVMIEIHSLFAKIIDPWVPYLEGPLSKSVTAQIYADYIRYGGADQISELRPEGIDYAFKQYSFEFNHTTTYHPWATDHWDKKAMQTQLEKFELGVKEILARRAKELYG